MPPSTFFFFFQFKLPPPMLCCFFLRNDKNALFGSLRWPITIAGPGFGLLRVNGLLCLVIEVLTQNIKGLSYRHRAPSTKPPPPPAAPHLPVLRTSESLGRLRKADDDKLSSSLILLLLHCCFTFTVNI